MDPIERKQQEEIRLNTSIDSKSKELQEIINGVTAAKDAAMRVVKSMELAIEKAQQKYFEYLKKINLAEQIAGETVVIRRRRG